MNKTSEAPIEFIVFPYYPEGSPKAGLAAMDGIKHNISQEGTAAAFLPQKKRRRVSLCHSTLCDMKGAEGSNAWPSFNWLTQAKLDLRQFQPTLKAPAMAAISEKESPAALPQGNPPPVGKPLVLPRLPSPSSLQAQNLRPLCNDVSLMTSYHHHTPTSPQRKRLASHRGETM